MLTNRGSLRLEDRWDCSGAAGWTIARQTGPGQAKVVVAVVVVVAVCGRLRQSTIQPASLPLPAYPTQPVSQLASHKLIHW